MASGQRQTERLEIRYAHIGHWLIVDGKEARLDGLRYVRHSRGMWQARLVDRNGVVKVVTMYGQTLVDRVIDPR